MSALTNLLNTCGYTTETYPKLHSAAATVTSTVNKTVKPVFIYLKANITHLISRNAIKHFSQVAAEEKADIIIKVAAVYFSAYFITGKSMSFVAGSIATWGATALTFSALSRPAASPAAEETAAKE